MRRPRVFARGYDSRGRRRRYLPDGAGAKPTLFRYFAILTFASHSATHG
jgi:hypothetical protein